MLENYEHAGRPLNTPILRDILNALEPWQESLPLSVLSIGIQSTPRRGSNLRPLEQE